MKILVLLTTVTAAVFALGFQGVVKGGADQTVATRLVTWQPKDGKEREFDEGYQRHLGWHRRSGDTWRWYGWDITSGERDGYFVDATFFHPWADLDKPVAPAEDGADNAKNVYPYADVRGVAVYETNRALTHLKEENLTAPLITFYSVRVPTAMSEAFENAVAGELKGAADSEQCVVFRPVSGTTEYLLAVTSARPSDLGQHTEFARGLLQRAANRLQEPSAVAITRVETARFRMEMSNLPGGAER